MKLKMLLIMILFLACAPTLKAQVSPSPSVDDAKVIRQLIADKEFYKSAYEESERQRLATALSRDSWKALYESEKNRADNIQGGRVTELQKALDKAEQVMRDDAQHIRELTADNIKLKSSRKWYFLSGLGVGAAAGAYGGYQLGNKTINVTQSPSQFGASIRF